MTTLPDEPDKPLEGLSDRVLWQRCRLVDVPEAEELRLLDLAAFADGGMDPDEYERVAAYVDADPEAAADVAAARTLAGHRTDGTGGLERIIARACALAPAAPAARGLILPFPGTRRQLLLHGLAQWGSLAAALAIAAWLGFAMGSDASLALSRPAASGDDSGTIELFDPASGFLHDLPAAVQT